VQQEPGQCRPDDFAPGVPDQPLPLGRRARMAIWPASDAVSQALARAYTRAGREVTLLDPQLTPSERLADRFDVIFLAPEWAAVRSALTELAATTAGCVVVACSSGVNLDADGFFMDAVEGGSVVQAVANALSRSRVVGAFQQFSAAHLEAATDGSLESDVPVVSDDREAADLVMGLIDELNGLDSLYAGPIRAAAGVEGLAAIVRTVGLERGRPVGFRLDHVTRGGLSFI
jgi:predicted dinucleotide-binding enzyme